MDGLRAVGLVIGLLSLVLACSRLSEGEGAAADIRGNVTKIYRADVRGRERGILGSILIEGVGEEDTKFDKASVTITEKTRIFEGRGRGRHPVKFEALELGQRVEARFTGPVLQSHPVQARAREIVILKSEK